MNSQKPINKKPKLSQHIKISNLNILAFSGSGFVVDTLDKLSQCFVIVYDSQQTRWTNGFNEKSELMNAMREWMCYNLHKNNFKTVRTFVKGLPPNLQQQFLLNICEGFKDFLENCSLHHYTGVKEACTQIITSRFFNNHLIKCIKEWNCFSSCPGNYLLYSAISGMEQITNTLVDLGIYVCYFDNLLTLPEDQQNIVEKVCKENGWVKIVEKLQT